MDEFCENCADGIIIAFSDFGLRDVAIPLNAK
jgi:hypothetical protein